MPKPTHYRPNVAGVILDESNKILLCERYDIRGAWQLPQGGIEEGESAKNAFLREMEEEIGTKELEIIGSLANSIRYDWPEKLYSRGYLGQEQFFFLARIIDENTINLVPKEEKQEFINFKWVGIAEFESSISGFKKNSYKTALAEMTKEFPTIKFSK